MTAELSITRIVNACVLLEIGGHAVLTDPYFEDHWFIRLRERIGLTAPELPRLSAIFGGYGVFDHWQPASLAGYRWKGETPVYVATRSMMRKARAAGFTEVEVLDWGESRAPSPRLRIEVAPARPAAGMKVNCYVLTCGDLRVFVGTEARDLEPLRRYRATRGAVDVALLPIDGARVLGHKLVMNAADAIAAARILGAKTLVPIHYALRPMPLLFQTPSSVEDLERLAEEAPDVRVVRLGTGVRWER